MSEQKSGFVFLKHVFCDRGADATSRDADGVQPIHVAAACIRKKMTKKKLKMFFVTCAKRFCDI